MKYYRPPISLKYYLRVIWTWLTTSNSSRLYVLFDSNEDNKKYDKHFKLVASHKGLKVVHIPTGIYENISRFDLRWIPWMTKKVQDMVLNQNKEL